MCLLRFEFLNPSAGNWDRTFFAHDADGQKGDVLPGSSVFRGQKPLRRDDERRQEQHRDAIQQPHDAAERTHVHVAHGGQGWLSVDKHRPAQQFTTS